MSWVRTSVALILSSKEFDPIAGIEVVKVTPLYVIAITFIGLFAFERCSSALCRGSQATTVQRLLIPNGDVRGDRFADA